MNARAKTVAKVGGFAVAALLAAGIGYALALNGSQPTGATSGTATSYDKSAQREYSPGAAAPQVVADSVPGASPGSASGSPSVSSPEPDRMVVSTAAMSIQVKDITRSLAAVRALAAASGGTIENLTVDVGTGPVPGPQPLDAQGAATDVPSSAQVTMRVPADKLARTVAVASKLGTVLSQSASATDVTQQHIDMSARLKNLQAEEARLRQLLDKATRVSEMLEVERELTRVRGEIESMQAQLAYLERQAAMSTLSLSLAAPGAIVRPSGTDWGFSAALTAGIQAAAALIRSTIVVAIALAPVFLVGLLLWLVWRVTRRRRTDARVAEDDDGAPADESTGHDSSE